MVPLAAWVKRRGRQSCPWNIKGQRSMLWPTRCMIERAWTHSSQNAGLVDPSASDKWPIGGLNECQLMVPARNRRKLLLGISAVCSSKWNGIGGWEGGLTHQRRLEQQRCLNHGQQMPAYLHWLRSLHHESSLLFKLNNKWRSLKAKTLALCCATTQNPTLPKKSS